MRLIRIVALVILSAVTSPAQRPIGDAKMVDDGTIQVWLRAEGPGGLHGDSFLTISPTDDRYQQWLHHLGGLKPGESKLVPPWPDSEARPNKAAAGDGHH